MKKPRAMVLRIPPKLALALRESFKYLKEQNCAIYPTVQEEIFTELTNLPWRWTDRAGDAEDRSNDDG